jgi:hypothetical protein
VDTQPQRFSAQKLKEYKDEHAYSVRERHGKGGTQTGRSKASKVERHTFALAVQMWQQSGGIGKEEYWHAFFKANPQILALALPNQVLLIGDKCYVGGKTWENIGGNIVDFLYANRQTKNVTLVEIKTPTTPLLGSEYRNGVFAPSDQLAGSIVQVFNYRSSLLKNFYSLSGADGRGGIEAHNPQCLVVVGNLETARLSAAQRSSFDLFRYGLAQCTVVTYDELFGKVQDVVDLLGE